MVNVTFRLMKYNGGLMARAEVLGLSPGDMITFSNETDSSISVSMRGLRADSRAKIDFQAEPEQQAVATPLPPSTKPTTLPANESVSIECKQEVQIFAAASNGGGIDWPSS